MKLEYTLRTISQAIRLFRNSAYMNTIADRLKAGNFESEKTSFFVEVDGLNGGEMPLLEKDYLTELHTAGMLGVQSYYDEDDPFPQPCGVLTKNEIQYKSLSGTVYKLYRDKEGLWILDFDHDKSSLTARLIALSNDAAFLKRKWKDYENAKAAIA